MVSVNFVPNCCFANVVSPGFDISLFTFGMIFPDIANTSSDVGAWLPRDFVVIYFSELMFNYFVVACVGFDTTISVPTMQCEPTFSKYFGCNLYKFYYFFFLATTWYQIVNEHTCSNLFHNFFELLHILKYALLGLLLIQRVIESAQIQAFWILRYQFI